MDSEDSGAVEIYLALALAAVHLTRVLSVVWSARLFSQSPSHRSLWHVYRIFRHQELLVSYHSKERTGSKRQPARMSNIIDHIDNNGELGQIKLTVTTGAGI
jgi:hypothetical protein